MTSTWLEVLPAIYRDNPKVAVVMASRSATIKTMRWSEYTAKVLVHGEVARGLQVVSPHLDRYLEHQRVITQMGLEMADPHYIGPLHDVPQQLLTNDLVPLVYLANAMWRPVLNLVGMALSHHVAEKSIGNN